MSLARVCCSFQVKLYKPLACVLCLLWFLWSYISTTSFFILLICKWCGSSVYSGSISARVCLDRSCREPEKNTNVGTKMWTSEPLLGLYSQAAWPTLELPCHHRPIYRWASLTTRKTQFHDSSMRLMYREYFVSTDLDLDTNISCLQTYVVNDYVFVSFPRHCPWLEEEEEKVQEATDSTHGCFLTDCTGKAQRLYFGLESWKTNLQWFNDLQK